MVALLSSPSSPQKSFFGLRNMAILDHLSAATPRSTLHVKNLFYLALIVSTFCLWFIYAWYQDVYTQLETIRAERNTAIASSETRGFEQKAVMEENTRLKAEFDRELSAVQSEMDILNSTFQKAGQDVGYKHFPGGQVPPVDGLSAEEVVVVIKTGATESYKALPIHLSTTLTHIPNVLLFSDHNQSMGQHHIQDALDEVTPDVMENNGDFQLYKDQKQYMALGQSPEFLELKGGWDLDKYKNMHMLSKSFKQRPDAKWYVFMDADSYVLMHNLLLYLSQLDHTQKLYLGSAAYINDLAFAHGGTGYAISHGTMKYLFEKEPDIAHKYDQVARDNCCGDYVLARALKDNDIEISWISPTFQGDPQYTLEMDKEKYCEPIVTLHHMLPRDISDVWQLEREIAEPGKYVLFQDLFEQFMYPHLKSERWDWDCMSGERGEEHKLPEETWEAHPSTEKFDEEKNKTITIPGKKLSRTELRKRTFDACRKVCEKKHDCIMFRTFQDECKIDWHLALGYKVPVSRDDNEDFRSGWMMDRVEEMRKEAPCKPKESGWAREKVQY